MRLRLTRLVGEVSPTAPRNAQGNITLKFPNVAAAEAWVSERQMEMKWNLDRSRNVDPNKARKAKQAGVSSFLPSFFFFFYLCANTFL